MRVPTSVAAFDEIVKGGVPAGSVIILAGEPGAGSMEFALTSVAKLSLARRNKRFRGFLIMDLPDIYVPSGALYITFSKSAEEIIRSVELTFREDLAEAFKMDLLLEDLSHQFFKNSIVPRRWISSQPSDVFKKKGDLLTEFVTVLDKYGNDKIVVVDSLTDLATSSVDIMDLVDVLKGLRRMAKQWNSVIYLLLTMGVLDQRRENLLYDSVDGVFMFEWHGSTKYSKRYRYMYVLKFTGLMAHLEEERVARFNTTLNRHNGFVVVNTEKIR